MYFASIMPANLDLVFGERDPESLRGVEIGRLTAPDSGDRSMHSLANQKARERYVTR